MSVLYTTTKTSILKWKDFSFPISIKDFKLWETAKVATYEYAGRNGAEHERVLNYRTFTLSGIFTAGVWDKTPSEYIEELRSTNDNIPWTLIHPLFGTFVCIMRTLTTTESGEEYSYLDNEYIQSYSFEVEFWEHTPPGSSTLQDEISQLFPITDVKPSSDYYETTLTYKNEDELYLALTEGKILPWVDPIINAEWLLYPYDMRFAAYQRWLIEPNPPVETTETVIEKSYTVQPGDTWIKIAKKNNVSFSDLFQENRGLEVRETSIGSEGLFRKTTSLLYAWDNLKIPTNA